MTTEVNKVISELYDALVGFPSNEEERFKKIISNWKDIKIDDTLHDLHYLISSLVRFAASPILTPVSARKKSKARVSFD